MTANMYRVGDYVYFETSSNSPYHIRRIEELNKTPNGNVEAKVMCFFRRRDLPSSLVMLADKHQQGGLEGEVNGSNNGPWGLNYSENELTPKQRHQLKHRELFLSRRVETVPATLIRGKCSVTLLNETESLLTYLNTDDMFFYCLVFDPMQKTLLADKGEIRVGSKYQADITPLLNKDETDARSESEPLETLVWTPSHGLTDRQIDQFLVISRSVGTFARALDCSSSVKQPSLHMSAAAASRDITLFYAMDTLHKHSYNLSAAISSLVPIKGPVLCRDEMEEWSASEANLFEEALEKYGKDFNDIRQDFIPWKTLKNIVEYYYMWKTTDRYVQQKRVKAVEAESKLKQVYIPNYNNKPASTSQAPMPQPPVTLNNKNIVNGTAGAHSNGRDFFIPGNSCEVCNVSMSSQWYPWTMSSYQCKLCHSCWTYWKRYGGFKSPSKLCENEIDPVKKKSGSISDEAERSTPASTPHRPHRCSIIGCGKEFKLKAHLARHYATSHGLAVRTGSPRPIMKTRTAFYLHASFLTRASRRLCQSLVPPRHIARSPFYPINVHAIKQECQTQLANKSPLELKELFKYRRRDRGSVTLIATRLAISRNRELIVPEWLAPTHKDKLPKSERVAFPKPPKGPDGSLLYEKIPNAVVEPDKTALNNLPPGMKKRNFDDANGVVVPQVGPPSKRVHREQTFTPAVQPPVAAELAPPCPVNLLNGNRSRMGLVARTGRKQVMSWMDAPDDLYFRSTTGTKNTRKMLTVAELRRAARKPWRGIAQQPQQQPQPQTV
ncbi:metastasis-associated protein MTA3 isoform X2 [Planococcus citri]|uniref:metastasis-associated protein MTA3 isoform X2 n=1 Tax=Planococcus citri TaxID=170843 RepID=UPI0031F7BA11